MRNYRFQLFIGVLILLMSCTDKETEVELVKLYESDKMLLFQSDEKIKNEVVKFTFLELYNHIDTLNLFFSLQGDSLLSHFEQCKKQKIDTFKTEDFLIQFDSKQYLKGMIKVYSKGHVKLWEDFIVGKNYLAGEKSFIYWTEDSLSNNYLVKKSIKSGKTCWSKKLPTRFTLEKLSNKELVVSDQRGKCYILNHHSGEIITDLSGLMERSYLITVLPEHNSIIAFGPKLICYNTDKEKVEWEKELEDYGFHSGLKPLFFKDEIIIFLDDHDKICFYRLDTGQMTKEIGVSGNIISLFKIYDKKLFFVPAKIGFCMIDLTEI